MRLEHWRGLCVAYRIAFQFHKGAIRTDDMPNKYVELAGFQFHKGAIRTPAASAVQPRTLVFQFHKGAIRTVAALKQQLSDTNFNSIKVRLERLRIVPAPLHIVFQFHKGAIRTYIAHPW